MNITAQCGACDKRFVLDAKYAGRKVRCKACGGVIVVPAGAAPSPPPQDDTNDDPFATLDALRSLEERGTADAPPPAQPARRARGAVPAPAAPSAVDDKLAPPAYQPKKLKSRGRPAQSSAGDAPEWAPSRADAYVSVPGEAVIDRLVLWLSFGLFVAGVLVPVVVKIGEFSHLEPGERINWYVMGYKTGVWARWVAGFAFVIFGVYAGLARLGVHIASRVMKFTPPRHAYLRCAAAACLAVSVQFIFCGLWFAGEFMSDPPREFHWALMLLTAVGLLWLTFRLRPAPFAATAGLAVGCAALVPWLIWWSFLLLLDVRVEYAFGRFRFNSAAEVRKWERLTAAPSTPRVDPPPAPPADTGSRPPTGATPAPPPRRAAVPERDGAHRPLPGERFDFAAHHAAVEASFKRIFVAAKSYAAAHDGAYPASFRDLWQEKLLAREDMRSPFLEPYEFAAGGRLPNPPPAKLVLVYEVGVKDKRRTVLWADGRVQTIDIANWDAMLSESNKIRAALPK